MNKLKNSNQEYQRHNHVTGEFEMWTGLTRFNETHFKDGTNKIISLVSIKDCFVGSEEFSDFLSIPDYLSVMIIKNKNKIKHYWANRHKIQKMNVLNCICYWPYMFELRFKALTTVVCFLMVITFSLSTWLYFLCK